MFRESGLTVRALLLLACAACAAGVTAPVGAQAPAAPSTRRALLIGVNSYQAVPGLSGSLNDVAAMREVLVTRWGFDARNIRTLTERAATRAGMLTALQQLVSAAGPNDVVYVHYSGHGSQVQDLNGDEDDGLDETLVPQDGRTGGVADITDDELDAIFSKLRAASTLIVLDSCHSGTATRALEIRTRSLPADTRIDLYRAPETRTRAIVPRMQSRYVVMSGAAANQEALDGPVDGQDRGFFSYSLSRSLAVSKSNASPRAVFAGVEQELRRMQAQFGRRSMPEPQLEGPPALLDQPLLAIRGTPPTAPRLASIEARSRGPGRVTLVNGMLLGAAPGSTWSLYPPGESAFTRAATLAVATVVQSPTGSLDAEAVVNPGGKSIPPGARAVMNTPASLARVIPIRIADVPPVQRADLEAMLRRTIGNVQIVGPGQPARFLIDMSGGTLRVLSADGMQVVAVLDTRTEQWSAALNRVISRSANASELLALDNPASRMQVTAQIIGKQPQSRDIVLADTRPAPLRMRRPGEPRGAQNSLQLAVTVNADAYLTIVDVDSEGNSNLLFPNPAQRPDFLPEGRVFANVPVLLPDSLASGNRAGFFWDYGPPVGLDTIRIFASTDAETARLIRERVRALQPGTASMGAIPASSGAGEGLEALRLDLGGLATRGIATVTDTATPAPSAETTQAPDWAAATVSVLVTE